MILSRANQFSIYVLCKDLAFALLTEAQRYALSCRGYSLAGSRAILFGSRHTNSPFLQRTSLFQGCFPALPVLHLQAKDCLDVSTGFDAVFVCQFQQTLTPLVDLRFATSQLECCFPMSWEWSSGWSEPSSRIGGREWTKQKLWEEAGTGPSYPKLNGGQNVSWHFENIRVANS